MRNKKIYPSSYKELDYTMTEENKYFMSVRVNANKSFIKTELYGLMPPKYPSLYLMDISF